MKEIIGACNRLLEIDLSHQRVTVQRISTEDRRVYLGGRGLGLKLLSDRLKSGIEPLGEENWLVLMLGVLMGTGAPCSGKFSVITKSPLTGILCHATCGGPFGLALKTAGYEGLLITGRAPVATMLYIDEAGGRLDSATHLWGLDTRRTQAALLKDSRSGAIVIGPAGEKKVRYANIASGDHSINRGGIGAVMGAKNLKAIVAKGGTFRVIPQNADLFSDATQAAADVLDANAITGRIYPKYGTASHVNWCNTHHMLAVKNFSATHHEKAGNVSGEAINFAFKPRPQPCVACRIKCGHATYREDGTVIPLPDYDALVMLGPNLGIFDAQKIIHWNALCGELGLDPVSMGGVLAWMMETGQKENLNSPIVFESHRNITKTIEAVAHRKGIGDELAQGTRYLGKTHGGEEFAIQIKGLELGAYNPCASWGQALGYAVANPGGCSHSAALFFLEGVLALLPGRSTRSKAHWVSYFENLFAAVNSLQMCRLTAPAQLMETGMIQTLPRGLRKPAMVHLPRILTPLIDIGIYTDLFNAVTGDSLSQKDFLTAGRRIHVLERWINVQEGICRKDDTLPQRFLTDNSADQACIRQDQFDRMLDEYYAVRGYDPQGIPSLETLLDLDISTALGEETSDIQGFLTKKMSDTATVEEENPPEKDLRKKIPYRLITSNQTVFQNYSIALALWLMGRMICAIYFVDRDVRRAFDELPEDFMFSLAVAGSGHQGIIAKTVNGIPRLLGLRANALEIDLCLEIKHIGIVSDIFWHCRKNPYLLPQQRVTIYGDMAAACSVIRILGIVMNYLLPRPLARQLTGNCPNISVGSKCWRRLLIVMRTIVGT